MIQICNLRKTYTDFTLDIPSLEIQKGEVIGLIGTNGSGKTTFLRLLLDLIIADEGEVCFCKKDVTKDHSWKKRTGSYLSEQFLIDYLNPIEYLQLIGEFYELTNQEFDSTIKKYGKLYTGLTDEKKLIRDLSSGNRKKIGLIAAILSKPDILILDEPFVHLDKVSQKDLQQIIVELNDQHNSTVIFSSHQTGNIEAISTKIYELIKGNLREQKTHDRLKIADTEQLHENPLQ